MVTATKVEQSHAQRRIHSDNVGKAGKKAKDAASQSLLDDHPDLKNTLAQIEKEFGEGAIMPLGVEHGHADRRHSHRQPVAGPRPGRPGHSQAAASSRSSAPNRAARPRWPCTSSPRPRRAGGIAAFIDAEHALDPSWAKKLGVELETLLVSQPGSGEEAMHITEMLIKSQRRRRDRHRLGGRPGAARRSWKARSAIRTSACRPG